jgi:cellulose 1,4-beta-cellobiosidase
MAHKGDSSVPSNTIITQEDGQPLPLVVTPVGVLSVKNGNTGGLAVSLPCKPTQNVTVKTTVIDGSGKLTVSAGASLTFTSGNFSTPQGVTLQSTAAQAGSFNVLVAPFGPDLPGFEAVVAQVLVS